MVNKLIGAGVLLLILSGLGLWAVYKVEENATQKAALESAAATIVAQAQEAEKSDRVLTETIKQREVIANDLSHAKKRIAAMQRTPVQVACDSTPVPDRDEYIRLLYGRKD